MQFLLIAYDYKDAYERRLAIRDKHVAYTDTIKKTNNVIFGTAILDTNEKMIGSMLVFDFPKRENLDKYLENEPYITGKVWEKIIIENCTVGPSFSR